MHATSFSARPPNSPGPSTFFQLIAKLPRYRPLDLFVNPPHGRQPCFSWTPKPLNLTRPRRRPAPCRRPPRRLNFGTLQLRIMRFWLRRLLCRKGTMVSLESPPPTPIPSRRVWENPVSVLARTNFRYLSPHSRNSATKRISYRTSKSSRLVRFDFPAYRCASGIPAFFLNRYLPRRTLRDQCHFSQSKTSGRCFYIDMSGTT